MKIKKSGQQDYNIHSIYMITESFQTKNCSDFCTANQSTKTNLRKYLDKDIKYDYIWKKLKT